MHGHNTDCERRCGGGHMESFLLLMFFYERGIMSIGEELLNAYGKWRKRKS